MQASERCHSQSSIHVRDLLKDVQQHLETLFEVTGEHVRCIRILACWLTMINTDLIWILNLFSYGGLLINILHQVVLCQEQSFATWLDVSSSMRESAVIWSNYNSMHHLPQLFGDWWRTCGKRFTCFLYMETEGVRVNWGSQCECHFAVGGVTEYEEDPSLIEFDSGKTWKTINTSTHTHTRLKASWSQPPHHKSPLCNSNVHLTCSASPSTVPSWTSRTI